MFKNSTNVSKFWFLMIFGMFAKKMLTKFLLSFDQCEQILVFKIFGMFAKKCSQILICLPLDQFMSKFWFSKWHYFWNVSKFWFPKWHYILECLQKKCSQIFNMLTFEPNCEQILVSKKASFFAQFWLQIVCKLFRGAIFGFSECHFCPYSIFIDTGLVYS